MKGRSSREMMCSELHQRWVGWTHLRLRFQPCAEGDMPGKGPTMTGISYAS